jgi:hypothetical protein
MQHKSGAPGLSSQRGRIFLCLDFLPRFPAAPIVFHVLNHSIRHHGTALRRFAKYQIVFLCLICLRRYNLRASFFSGNILLGSGIAGGYPHNDVSG